MIASAWQNRRFWFTVALVATVLKLWLVAAQPIVAIGGAGHDDRLYLSLAQSILEGDWLGTYSRMTLAKGPMYSVWIAGTVITGLPLPLANHLLYLFGCVLMVKALRTHLRSPGNAGILFLLLWWNPMTYEMPVLGRILRQNLYTPATLLLFAALIALTTERHASRFARASWGGLLGWSAAVLWLTREETIWALPSAALLMAAAAWTAWRLDRTFRLLALPLSIATLLGGGAVTLVCTLNQHYYGWFGTVEFRAPQFVGAYGSLQRVRSSYELPYVPVTREAREALYLVSPAFAELKPYLEGEIGTAWAGACEALTGRNRSEREIAGGWFMWALRDAVAAAGHAPNARAALEFYGRMAAEINAACDRGLVPARPRRDSLVPPWRGPFARALVTELPRSGLYVATFRDFSAVTPSSTGDPGLLQLFRDLTRWPVAPSPEAPALDRPQQQRWDTLRISLLDHIGRTMGWISTAITTIALVVWTWLPIAIFRGRRPSYLALVATAAAIAVVAVIGVNTLVHVMSFPNRSPGAFAQAYPALLLFSVVMLIEAPRLFRRPALAASTSARIQEPVAVLSS